jgi:hypothetical protein
MTTYRPTPQQLKALTLAAVDGRLVPVGGGYWMSGASSREDRESVRNGFYNTAEHISTATVYACQVRGWLSRTHEARNSYLDPRKITSDGRETLAVHAAAGAASEVLEDGLAAKLPS